MPTYLYCLAPSADATDPQPAIPPGIDGGAVRVLAAGALEAWVSTILTSSPPATVHAIRQHAAVVNAALATGRTPLPARFGQSWPSDAACVASVTERAAELEPLVRRVAGMVEMTVCTLVSGMPPAVRPSAAALGDAAPGTAYLQHLRARADREQYLRTVLEELRARVSRALGPLARGEVAEIRGSDEALTLSISYLVERDGEAPFRRAVDEVAREAVARLVVAGPRAPYSFAPAARQPGRAHADRPADRL
jgi:gas vesicle protein GvpL/GvpF